ncbi:Yip1-domain-containing protein [Exidia glandulosa HHB12029]|uniref:Protein YIP n=1 Tax=Exidia glandulosa HHB12029 TaxID=1314781 RepID=A0A165GQE0_EXIGL|nr:Yip1-domain-containing protein [Exidia glandulosa HHB12029]KZV97411.1 Yip1-domain-containing protein [Exidia glandulosa HHB12029]
MAPSPTLPTPNKGKGRATSPLPPSSPLPTPGASSGVSGNIGTSSQPAKQQRQTVAGVRVETRSTGVDTLDEPVSTTILRDLLSIYTKLVQVLYPLRTGEGRAVLRDWDLWGPLIFCLLLGSLLSINAKGAQGFGIFTGVIVIISVGSVVVTIQTKLLGGRVSFLQGLCVLGYCLAPLDIAAIVATFVPIMWVRLPVTLASWAWCVWAAMNFLDGTKIESQRIVLAVYPLVLFYFILAWMIIIE